MKPTGSAAVSKKLQHTVSGVFTQQEGIRLSILNGSHTTISEHHDRETVLIFPDYRIVFGVENTPKAAELLYEKAISPSTTYIPTIPEEREDGELPFGILPIPYSCVILLCALSILDSLVSLTHSLAPSRFPQATRQPLPRRFFCPRTWCVHRYRMNHGIFLKITRVHRTHSRLTTPELDSGHQPRPPPPPRRPSPIQTSHRHTFSSRPRL